MSLDFDYYYYSEHEPVCTSSKPKKSVFLMSALSGLFTFIPLSSSPDIKRCVAWTVKHSTLLLI